LTEPLPPRLAAGLIETIARAVGHIHGRGLFHLDLKPSNILLDGEANEPWDRLTPRIADFGLALSSDDAGASVKSLAGIRRTPSYMALEQASASGATIGAAADIHALYQRQPGMNGNCLALLLEVSASAFLAQVRRQF
jgi:eukaryotic-like serine/threonine-protein kinase